MTILEIGNRQKQNPYTQGLVYSPSQTKKHYKVFNGPEALHHHQVEGMQVTPEKGDKAEWKLDIDPADCSQF